LFEEGVLSSPIVPPTVPAGHSLLRLSFMATHSDTQLDRVLSLFEKVGRKLGLIPDAPPQSFPKVALARPGTFVIAGPASPRWTHSNSGGVTDSDQRSSRELATKLFDVMETLTWRAANLQPDDLRRLSSAPLRLWNRRGELSDYILEKGAGLLMKAEPEK